MSGSHRILGKGQVLGTFSRAAELSAAFAPGPEARMAHSVAADAAIASLVQVIHQRVGMDVWLWAFGDGPDDLATLSEARGCLPGLDSALEDAEESEAVALLAVLAGIGDRQIGRMFSSRARRLLESGSPGSSPLRLALRAGPDDVAERVRAFRSHGGPALPFWLADRTLGVRFWVDHRGAAFRAHHPVIQDELIARCERDGVDLM